MSCLRATKLAGFFFRSQNFPTVTELSMHSFLKAAISSSSNTRAASSAQMQSTRETRQNLKKNWTSNSLRATQQAQKVWDNLANTWLDFYGETSWGTLVPRTWIRFTPSWSVLKAQWSLHTWDDT